MSSSVCRFALWSVLIMSGWLIAWQAWAYLGGRMPDHFLPWVRLLSGTQESVPVAYSWAMKLGLLSVTAFLGSGLLLVWSRFIRKRAAS